MVEKQELDDDLTQITLGYFCEVIRNVLGAWVYNSRSIVSSYIYTVVVETRSGRKISTKTSPPFIECGLLRIELSMQNLKATLRLLMTTSQGIKAQYGFSSHECRMLARRIEPCLVPIVSEMNSIGRSFQMILEQGDSSTIKPMEIISGGSQLGIYCLVELTAKELLDEIT